MAQKKTLQLSEVTARMTDNEANLMGYLRLGIL
jgi:hypothetical protein